MSEKAEIGVEIVCDGGVVAEREVSYNGISETKIKLNPWLATDRGMPRRTLHDLYPRGC